jgi:hypothetical protein
MNLRLPSRVNRETSKTSTTRENRPLPSEPGDRCIESHDYTTTVTVIIQRIR